MKTLNVLAIVSVLFAPSAFAKSPENHSVKNKSAHEKVVKHHQRHWNQPTYSQQTRLFRCSDSWGNKLRGHFTQEQQYLIELGGGYCRQMEISRRNTLSEYYPVLREDFDLNNIYRAVNEIRSKYRLRQAKVVETYNVVAGHKTMKYTISFETHNHTSREFRVKHDRRSGQVRSIREV